MSEWTDDRVELLKKLWADGLTASEIAAEIGGISRNGVIGKVTRLELPPRIKPVREIRTGLSRKESAARRSAAAKLRAAPSRIASLVTPGAFGNGKPPPAPDLQAIERFPAEPLPESRPVSILDLTSTTCRWIVGDSRKPLEAIYCGAKGADFPNEPYCKCHSDMAGSGYGRDMSKFKAA